MAPLPKLWRTREPHNTTNCWKQQSKEESWMPNRHYKYVRLLSCDSHPLEHLEATNFCFPSARFWYSSKKTTGNQEVSLMEKPKKKK